MAAQMPSGRLENSFTLTREQNSEARSLDIQPKPGLSPGFARSSWRVAIRGREAAQDRPAHDAKLSVRCRSRGPVIASALRRAICAGIAREIGRLFLGHCDLVM